MSSISLCPICSENYDYDQHKPLILECEHTLCRKCIVRLKNRDIIPCPFCNKETYTHVDRLIFIRQLIPSDDHRPTQSKPQRPQQNPSGTRYDANGQRQVLYGNLITELTQSHCKLEDFKSAITNSYKLSTKTINDSQIKINSQIKLVKKTVKDCFDNYLALNEKLKSY